jgi:hypothetical protein
MVLTAAVATTVYVGLDQRFAIWEGGAANAAAGVYVPSFAWLNEWEQMPFTDFIANRENSAAFTDAINPNPPAGGTGLGARFYLWRISLEAGESIVLPGPGTAGGNLLVFLTESVDPSDYVQEFSVTVNVPFTGVTGAGGVQPWAAVGDTVLRGFVYPDTATFQAVTYSVEDAGTTGAVINGNVLTTTGEGTAVIRLTAENGLAVGVPFTTTVNVAVQAESLVPLSTDVAPVNRFDSDYLTNITINADISRQAADSFNIGITMSSGQTVSVPFDFDGVKNVSFAARVDGDRLITYHAADGGTFITSAVGLSDGGAYIVSAEFENAALQRLLIATNVGMEGFVPVSDITGVPAQVLFGGTVFNATVVPLNPTNREISWSIVDNGGTDAEFDGDLLTVSKLGTIIVRASVAEGLWAGVCFVKDFAVEIADPDDLVLVVDEDFSGSVNWFTNTVGGVTITHIAGGGPNGSNALQAVISNQNGWRGSGRLFNPVITGKSYQINLDMRLGSVAAQASQAIGLAIHDGTLRANNDPRGQSSNIIRIIRPHRDLGSLYITTAKTPLNAPGNENDGFADDAGWNAFIGNPLTYRVTDARFAAIDAWINVQITLDYILNKAKIVLTLAEGPNAGAVYTVYADLPASANTDIRLLGIYNYRTGGNTTNTSRLANVRIYTSQGSILSQAQAPLKLPAPANLHWNGLTAVWDATPSGGTGYEYELLRDGAVVVEISSWDFTMKNFQGLVRNQSIYTLNVRAVNAAEPVLNSEWAAITLDMTAVPFAPAPENLRWNADVLGLAQWDAANGLVNPEYVVGLVKNGVYVNHFATYSAQYDFGALITANGAGEYRFSVGVISGATHLQSEPAYSAVFTYAPGTHDITKDDLLTLINRASGIHAHLYTDATAAAIAEPLGGAIYVYWQAESTAVAVNAAYAALAAAMDGLVLKAVERIEDVSDDELFDMIIYALGVNAWEYGAEMAATLHYAVTIATHVFWVEHYTQDAVNAVYTLLAAVLDGLTSDKLCQESKNEFLAKIFELGNISGEGYTPNSYATMMETVSFAIHVYWFAEFTPEGSGAVTALLNAVEAGLVEIGEADKDALLDAINAANAVIANAEATGVLFTDASFAVLANALGAAVHIYWSATEQGQVDAAVVALNAAVAGLQIKTDGVTRDDLWDLVINAYQRDVSMHGADYAAAFNYAVTLGVHVIWVAAFNDGAVSAAYDILNAAIIGLDGGVQCDESKDGFLGSVAEIMGITDIELYTAESVQAMYDALGFAVHMYWNVRLTPSASAAVDELLRAVIDGLVLA